MRRTALAVLMAGLTMVGACSSPAPSKAGGTVASPLPQGGEPVRLDPAKFLATIDHPYWPMKPGSRWVFRETEPDGTAMRVEITVTDETRQILGITATVVHDRVTLDGNLVEDTFDWYAQDREGNLWYLGERTAEYEDGVVVSREGSWEAGVDGAQPGILLPGAPSVGLGYRQEYLRGEAEDEARILSVDERVEVPAGSYEHALVTRDVTPLHPEIVEYKIYAKGVGLVLAFDVSGGAGREALTSFREG